MAFLKLLKMIGAGCALVGSVWVAGCVETIENDYEHSSSVHGDADSGVWEKIDEAAQGG